MTKIGIIHGRFQPFHNSHMNYALKAKKKCDLLIVGITNPDPNLTKYDKVDPRRSDESSNPFTYFERHFMIREALSEAGIKRKEFEIVPFPINKPELLKYYVPIKNSTFFMTIYDNWGLKKKKVLESIGARVEVLREGNLEDKGICSTGIRNKILSGEKWDNLVPKAVYRIIKEWDLESRIK